MTDSKTSIKIRVSPEVARVVAASAPRELKLSVARGVSCLGAEDQVTALFFLCQEADPVLKTAALATLRGMPSDDCLALAADSSLHPQLLNFLLRLKVEDVEVARALVVNPSLPDAAVLFAASRCGPGVLEALASDEALLARIQGLREAIVENPRAGDNIRELLESESLPEVCQNLAPETDELEVSSAPQEQGEPEDAEETETVEESEDDPEYLSKVKIASELGVSEKIKLALTGDKEWRRIFLKDTNKLVCAAAIRNPRITDGEVLAVAKNKSSNDELIRLICLNREWVKSYEIKKALVLHPKTPLPKALRYMDVLGNKDLKQMAKSRSISPVLVNNARRMLTAKDKKQ